MKKVILYSLLTVLSVMFYECGKSEEAPGETYTFQFSEEDWAVPVAGANKTFRWKRRERGLPKSFTFREAANGSMRLR